MEKSHMEVVVIVTFGVNQVLKQQLRFNHKSKMIVLLSEASSLHRGNEICCKRLQIPSAAVHDSLQNAARLWLKSCLKRA